MKFFLLSLVVLIAACASQPEKVTAAYISPLQYINYDCTQLAAESSRVSMRTSALHGTLKSRADTDEVQMGVGLLLLWPTLFWLDGDGPETQEYARLKGERDAIETAAIQKSCGLTPQPMAMPPTPNVPTAEQALK